MRKHLWPARTMPKIVEFEVKNKRDKDQRRPHCMITCVRCGKSEMRVVNGTIKYCLECRIAVDRIQGKEFLARKAAREPKN